MRGRDLLRDGAIALSLANLLFFRRWAELFTVTQPKAYYLKLTLSDFSGTALALAFVAAVFFAGARLRVFRWGRPLVMTAFAMALVLLANHVGIRKRPGLLGVALAWGENPSLAVLLTLGTTIGAFVFVRWQTRIRTLAVSGLLLIFPFALFNVAKLGWYAATTDFRQFEDRAPPLASVGDGGSGPRVVVLLFDALGRALAFDSRPATVAMPAFDRLRAGSVDAINVFRAGEHTREAVPGFLSGVHPDRGDAVGPNELRLVLSDGRSVSWASLPNAFRAAREAGGVATVAGWYHPYCRIFASDLDGCSMVPASTCGGQVEWSVPAAFFSSLRAMSPFTVYRDRHARGYRAVMLEAATAVSKRGKGLTFVHLPVPHYPAIYDASSGELTAFNFRLTGYEDQLQLADRALAELRAAMEAAGTWESSTVLVTSDHPSGGATRLHGLVDDEVPFLVKLPGQSSRIELAQPISAATGYPLLRALLEGEITTPADAVTWLENNALPPRTPLAHSLKESDP